MNDHHLTEVERLLDPDERRTTNRDIAMSRERMAADSRRRGTPTEPVEREQSTEGQDE